MFFGLEYATVSSLIFMKSWLDLLKKHWKFPLGLDSDSHVASYVFRISFLEMSWGW